MYVDTVRKGEATRCVEELSCFRLYERLSFLSKCLELQSSQKSPVNR